MVRIITSPRRIEAAGTPKKMIEEYIGEVVSGTSDVSIARMKSPPGWSEPIQTPDFDEYTVVLSGVLEVWTPDGNQAVHAGQAVIIPRGTRVRYSSPLGAEYIAVCLPAFTTEMANREEEVIIEPAMEKIDTHSEYTVESHGPDEIDRIYECWTLLREYIISRTPLFADRMGRVTFAERRQDILEKNRDGEIRVFLAIIPSGDVIGYCLCSAGMRGRGEIESIYVKEQYRRSGIGRVLIKDALLWMQATGARDIKVHVTVGNEETIGFYQKFGLYPRQYILEVPGGESVSVSGNDDNFTR